MKYRKLVKKHTKVAEHYEDTRTLCDFCNRDLDEVSKKASSFDYSRIKLDAKIGSYYPEGDTRSGYRLDCCIECFEDKLTPAIESIGVKWQEYDPEMADYYKLED